MLLAPAAGAAQTGPAVRPTEAALSQLEGDDFVECYRVHYPRLVRALELAGSSRPVAEDAAQEAFARMLARWRRVRTGSSPAGYAYRTAFRLLQRRGPPAPTEPAEAAGVGPEGLITTRAAVAGALAGMPPRRRACAVLYLVVGLPTSEVADALGIAEGTVRKHVEEARVDLRAGLADGGRGGA